MLTAIALFALILPKQATPRFLWNASLSVPIGLYSLSSRQPSKRRLAVIRLPEPFLGLAHVRAYLPAGTLLIKPVAAADGDVVCRRGPTITINGRAVALAKVADARGRLLPRWRGCMRLAASQIFVLAADADSFDSRYVGALDRRHVLGTALPLRLDLIRLLQPFERAVELRERTDKLGPELREIGNRIVLRCQLIEVETAGHQRFQCLPMQFAGGTRRL